MNDKIIKKTSRTAVTYYILSKDMNLIANISRKPNKEGGNYKLYFSSNGESTTHIPWETNFIANTDEEAIQLGKEKLIRQLNRFIERIQEVEVDSYYDQSETKFNL